MVVFLFAFVRKSTVYISDFPQTAMQEP